MVPLPPKEIVPLFWRVRPLNSHFASAEPAVTAVIVEAREKVSGFEKSCLEPAVALPAMLKVPPLSVTLDWPGRRTVLAAAELSSSKVPPVLTTTDDVLEAAPFAPAKDRVPPLTVVAPE